jgi:hypothetical protein
MQRGAGSSSQAQQRFLIGLHVANVVDRPTNDGPVKANELVRNKAISTVMGTGIGHQGLPMNFGSLM